MRPRIIIHIDMDYFFAQVEERDNPRFKGKPIVVGAEPQEGHGRGVVSTANYIARKYGIHSALPISQAYKLCPQAIFLPPDIERYVEVSNKIMEIVRKHAFPVEQLSLDEAYVDVSSIGTFAKAEKLALDMKEEILQNEQLTCTVGVGPNKMIAKIACSFAKPDGLKVVLEKDAKAFVGPLDIERMPGIGEKTASSLRKLGLRIVFDLQQLSLERMKELFGNGGEDMYQRVRGIDDTFVQTEHEVKSIGKDHTFQVDTRDPEQIVAVCNELCSQVGEEVENTGVAFKTITVVCRFSGFETHTKSKTLATYARSKGVLTREAMKLLLQFIVSNLKPIRLIGVRVSHLS